MVVIEVSSESENVTAVVTATIPASTPLYLQEQLRDRLYDRAILMTDSVEEYLIIEIENDD